MDLACIKNELLDKPYLSGIKISKNSEICDKTYTVSIKCNLKAGDLWYPIKIGIPDDWAQYLIDLYIAAETIPYIPHIDNKGKLCLYDLEGSFIEKDLLGVLNQCILQAQSLIKEGVNKENWNDFFKEFDSYIMCLPGCKIAKVVIPELKENQKISYCATNKIGKKREKKETYAEYLKRAKAKSFFASSDANDFKSWGYKNQIKNGLYLYIEAGESIYPPKIDRPLDIECLNAIFKSIKLTKTVNKLIENPKKELFLVFGIKQPEGSFNTFGAIIKDADFDTRINLKLKSMREAIPLFIERLDEHSLLSRTAFDKNVLSDKKYLLIGCGSIGGYVFSDLIKSGCKDITLIDHDLMKPENIYRHLLGKDYIGYYKAEALRIFGEKSLPGLKIKTVDEKLQNAFEDAGIEFDDYDYIIAATGNSILNSWINNYVNNTGINTPIFYIWNEPLDIGSHVAIIQRDRIGCYDCIFRRDETIGLYDFTSYCKPGQKFVENVSGCSGSFIPYGSLISVQSSLLFMDLLKKFAEGRISENIIASEKGDDFYLKKSGLILSNNYINQNKKISIMGGRKFRNIHCKVCGEK